MMADNALHLAKLEQAATILREVGIDAWLIYVRETALNPDPITPLLWDFAVVWPAAFIITADGQRIATAVVHDVATLERSGLFTRVVPFQRVAEETLPELIAALDPQSIALNYSPGNVAADGLSHGLYLRLQEMFADTPYAARLTSAEGIIGRLRQRKLPGELTLCREACRLAQDVFDYFDARLRPGLAETELAAIYRERMAQLGVGPSWEASMCPNMNAGPHTGTGHVGPLPDVIIQPGDILNVDFGVKANGYSSDQQRMWYLLRPGESAPPEAVLRPFRAVVGAIQAGFDALRPGIPGWQVDAAARAYLAAQGYPEYLHALGHNVGTYAHDGGIGMLAPAWPSYGSQAHTPLEAGQLLTIELGVTTEWGYFGLEEEALITADGAEWFWPPQKELYLIADKS
jgi:Xaa-Pro aminopeptidase